MGIPVWLIASSFEPRGSTLYTLRLARRLPAFGFDPLIVCESAAKIPPALLEDLRVREHRRLSRRLLSAWRLGQLVKSTGAERPALLHAQRHTMEEPTAELAEQFGCPYLVTLHQRLHQAEDLQIHHDRFAGAIAVSPSVERDALTVAGLTHRLVHVIPNGVDIDPIPKLVEPRAPQKIPVVGACSVLEPIKGLMHFLLAAQSLLQAGVDAEFVIAGVGPDEQTLRRSAQQLGIAPQVTFVTDFNDYSRVLQTLDVFVLPSLEQGLGTVMLEALALGKPVVATKVGGVADFLVDGKHALLAAGGDHEALASHIKSLLVDPTLARRLAVTGQQLVREHFSAERMAQRTAQLYQQVLQPLPTA